MTTVATTSHLAGGAAEPWVQVVHFVHPSDLENRHRECPLLGEWEVASGSAGAGRYFCYATRRTTLTCDGGIVARTRTTVR